MKSALEADFSSTAEPPVPPEPGKCTPDFHSHPELTYG